MLLDRNFIPSHKIIIANFCENCTQKGLLTEGFFWIPSLAGPTSIAARQSGSGVSWLFPFVVIALYVPMAVKQKNCSAASFIYVKDLICLHQLLI